MTDKMTDEQIIKALECFKSEECLGEQCPYFEKEGLCGKPMCSDVYDFIYRQNAEIEKLNVELVGMRGACESYKMHYDNARAEIERLKNAYKQCAWERDVFSDKDAEIDRLKESNKRLGGQMGSLIHHLETAKSEAYEELADKLHDNFISKVQKRYCLLSSNPYKYTEGYTADDVLSTIVNTLEELTRNLHESCTESNE